MCSMDKDVQESLNYLPVKCVPLLLTNVFGVRKRLKSSFSTLTVFVDVRCLHLNISGHLEKLSTIIRYSDHLEVQTSRCVTSSTDHPF